MQKKLFAFFILNCLVLGGCIYRFGGAFFEQGRTNLLYGVCRELFGIYAPVLAYGTEEKQAAWYQDFVTSAFPNIVYCEKRMQYEQQLETRADYENLVAYEQNQMKNLLDKEADWNKENTSEQDVVALAMAENEKVVDTYCEEPAISDNQTGENTSVEHPASDTTYSESTLWPVASEKVFVVNRDKLQDFDYLKQNFYIVDSSTTITSEQININSLLGKNVSIDHNLDGPQILIYHTHSQEGYADAATNPDATVVAVGEYLTQILTEQYGYQVLHHTGAYDVQDRAHAYSNAAPAIEQILKDYPQIQVVIDLHRDDVKESTHLVTEINGKQTAKIMFFNGLCRTAKLGELTSLPNPYLADNLALSFQMQMAAMEYYPDFTRKIYLKGYRYNMHFCPKTMLIEVGAQNNTLEEAKNAMEPLADILSKVLQ